MKTLLPPILAAVLLLVACGNEKPERTSSSASRDSALANHKLTPWTNWSDWRDTSSHRSGYMKVGDVRLHILDWGGTGEPVVLLPGIGNGAHIFDDMAPELSDRWHVYAMTYRGHHQSDDPKTGYDITTLAKDLLGVLDGLELGKVNLVGHSLGGAVITRFAALYPDRVARLVYIDATNDYKRLDEVLNARPFQRPQMTEQDMANLDNLRSWLTENQYGFWMNAMEADARVNELSQEGVMKLLDDLKASGIDYAKVTMPALAIRAVPTLESEFPWLRRGMSADSQATAKEYLSAVVAPWHKAGEEQFLKGAKGGRVIEIPGHHYLFITQRDSVVEAIRAFLAGPSK